MMQLPNLVSKFNSFEDMTTILKNRGMLAEAKKEEVTAYKKPEVDPVDLIAPDLLDDGIKAELEAAKIEGTPSEEEYEKAKEKAANNLAKDPLHYKNAQTMPETGEKMEKATLKEGREQLLVMLESIIDKAKAYAKDKYPHFTEEDINDFVRMHGKDIMKGAKLEAEFDNFADANSNLDEEDVAYPEDKHTLTPDELGYDVDDENEVEDIKLTTDQMEKLRRERKITLPNGSVLHYVGEVSEYETPKYSEEELAQMAKDQEEHDEETLRRERGLEERQLKEAVKVLIKKTLEA